MKKHSRQPGYCWLVETRSQRQTADNGLQQSAPRAEIEPERQAAGNDVTGGRDWSSPPNVKAARW